MPQYHNEPLISRKLDDYLLTAREMYRLDEKGLCARPAMRSAASASR